jgi:DNA polymerase-3 subunit alpha
MTSPMTETMADKSPAQMFVHLHVHTEYSLVDGLIEVPALVDAVREAGMPAVAVTDHTNVFAAVKFYQAAERAGIKPLLGAEVWLHRSEAGMPRARVVLLCMDREGFRQLSILLTRSYREGQVQGIPHVAFEWLQQGGSSRLIALSAGLQGEVGQLLLEGQTAQAERAARDWADCFPDRFYLEISRTGRTGEEDLLVATVALADRLAMPLVATNDVRFLSASDFDAHEARVCIHEGRTLADPRRPRAYTAQQYLRSAEEMLALFADLPDALANTVEIARRCNAELEFGRYHLPNFPVPADLSVEALLARDARTGLALRLAEPRDERAPQREASVYEARLALELDVITKMGFAGYFLIVADFIQWAKRNEIPVGPGRGSGAGSLVAYVLGITELDPLDYDLLFERFLNPERISMPDFDVDFCMDRRDEVIDYVNDRYGRDKVSQIITYGTMAAKAVLRDVGRVLGFPYGFVDQVAKLVPFDPNMTLARALDEEPQLKTRYRDEEDVRAMVDLGLALEGLSRNAGKHAGGIVIAPQPLTEFMPLYCEEGSDTAVSQFDMSDVEAVGLVKFDFLGLRTLTIIDWTVREVNQRAANNGQPALDIARLPLHDAPTYALVQAAQTTAVFQLESRGMKELIKRLKPDTFEDLIALVALFRPGPLQSGMVDDFIDRKHGRAAVKYPHPELEDILKPTYGVILYQEQVMQIAQVLAGYSLGAADLLRRAMGKKKPEEMARQRETFVGGATGRGIDGELAAQIFDLMEKFAGYGFNKSHSAAYALLAYQTAWLKAHHPAAFMAAVLSADMDSTDKVVRLIEECRQMGLTVEPPALNTCAYRFTVADERTIRYGLGAIKGVGEAALSALVEEREARGPYRDLFELCARGDARKLNRRVLEALIKAGALDCLGARRRALMTVLEQAMQAAEQAARAAAVGQVDLFGGGAVAAPEGLEADTWRRALALEEWAQPQLLNWEKETLGLYLSGHPMDRYRDELRALGVLPLADLRPGRRRAAGLIVALRFTRSRRGRMAILTLDDHSARVEVTVYNETLEACIDKLAADRLVIIDGEVSIDDFSGEPALNAQAILQLDEARQRHARTVLITLQAGRDEGVAETLHTALRACGPGGCAVAVDYHAPQARARLRLGDDWRVLVNEALLEQLRGVVGEHAVRVEY